ELNECRHFLFGLESEGVEHARRDERLEVNRVQFVGILAPTASTHVADLGGYSIGHGDAQQKRSQDLVDSATGVQIQQTAGIDLDAGSRVRSHPPKLPARQAQPPRSSSASPRSRGRVPTVPSSETTAGLASSATTRRASSRSTRRKRASWPSLSSP